MKPTTATQTQGPTTSEGLKAAMDMIADEKDLGWYKPEAVLQETAIQQVTRMLISQNRHLYKENLVARAMEQLPAKVDDDIKRAMAADFVIRLMNQECDRP